MAQFTRQQPTGTNENGSPILARYTVEQGGAVVGEIIRTTQPGAIRAYTWTVYIAGALAVAGNRTLADAKYHAEGFLRARS
jgi:hypothetical protein